MLDKNTFKLVCDDCGSLTIRAENYDRADAAAIIECGRCKSQRGRGRLFEISPASRAGTE